MFGYNIQREILKSRLIKNAPMSETEFFASELNAWEHSPMRREMIDGERYYIGDHDILRRKRTSIGKDGEMKEVKHLPNARIVDNLYAKHADQKKNYLLGKPITFESDNKIYAEKVSGVLGNKFMRVLKNAGLAAINTGIAWLYPYYGEDGLEWRFFSGSEILPFWIDEAHTKIDCAARLYAVETYVGRERKIVKKVDIFKKDGLSTYIFDNGTLYPDPDSPQNAYVEISETNGETKKFNWDKIPLIPIKYNSREIPLIRRARSLQDAINELRSDFVNNMQENVHNTILVIKNYDGTDLGEFRQNLNTYGAVKVRTVEGADGAVETLQIDVSSENYDTVLKMLKNSLIENMRSFDGKDERLSNNPNQMNIQALYADIDIDANDTETELQAAFDDIFWFVNQYLANNGEGNFNGVDIRAIFNRDVLINESEAIANCQASVGIISDETIITQHPWINDPQGEFEKVKRQREEATEQYNPFGEPGPGDEE